jgi:hypothetical protein
MGALWNDPRRVGLAGEKYWRPRSAHSQRISGARREMVGLVQFPWGIRTPGLQTGSFPYRLVAAAIYQTGPLSPLGLPR